MVGITVVTVLSIYLMSKMRNNMLDYTKRIVNKKTLRYFLECDRLALKKTIPSLSYFEILSGDSKFC